jgi:hypothetical protein
VNQTEGPVTVSEGALLTLNCTYQTASLALYLFWYIQHLNKAPQFLLKGSMSDQNPKSKGFEATLVKRDSSFHLQKQAVQASDSAVYYCALSDTVREGCGGAEHKPRVQMGLWLWAAPQGVLFLSPEVLSKHFQVCSSELRTLEFLDCPTEESGAG